MGTNFYRIPSEHELQERRSRLLKRVVNELDMPTIHLHLNPDCRTMWDEFIQGAYVHLGKASVGWRFVWNFHDRKYYHDRTSLIEFIQAGTIIDEYGRIYTAKEFINMAMSWYPDGHIFNQQYVDELRKSTPGVYYGISSDTFDVVQDELVICSSTEFS
jgi:hypothetical protein